MAAVNTRHEHTTQTQGMADVLLLAGQDLRRQWLSYLVSVAYLVLMSLLTIGSGDLMGGSEPVEYVLIALVLFISTPFFWRDYFSWTTDLVAERLTWLRSLPISARTIVQSRVLTMLAVAPINLVAFFGPIYLSGAWSLGTRSFFLFVVSFFGLSLVGAGYHLCMEFGLSLRWWLITNVVVSVPLIALLIVLGLFVNIRIFAGLGRAIESNGFISLACLAVGIASIPGCARLAERLLQRRDLHA